MAHHKRPRDDEPRATAARKRGRLETSENGAAAQDGAGGRGGEDGLVEAERPYTGLLGHLQDHQFSNADEQLSFLAAAHSHVVPDLRSNPSLLRRPVVARAVESLARASTSDHIRVLLEALVGSFASLARGKASSHALETVLAAVPHAATSDDADEGQPIRPDDSVAPRLGPVLLRISQELGRDARLLLTHAAGSFVLRCVLRVASGPSGGGQERVVFRRTVRELAKQVIRAVVQEHPEASRLSILRHPPASAVLQSAAAALLRVGAPASQLCPLVRIVMNHLAALATDSAGSPLIESLAQSCGDRDFGRIWVGMLPLFSRLALGGGAGSVLVGRFAALVRTGEQVLPCVFALLPVAKRSQALQLLESVSSESLFVRLLRKPSLGPLIGCADMALRHPAVRSPFCSALLRSLASLTTECPEGLLSTRSGRRRASRLLMWDGFRVAGTHFGLVLMGRMLRFPHALARPFVGGLCRGRRETVVSLLLDRAGALAVEGWLQECRGKDANTLVRRMEGSIVRLSGDRNGSHIIERLFGRCSPGSRLVIASELAAGGFAATRTPQGAVVCRSCQVDLFKRDRAGWIRRQKMLTERDEKISWLLGE